MWPYMTWDEMKWLRLSYDSGKWVLSIPIAGGRPTVPGDKSSLSTWDMIELYSRLCHEMDWMEMNYRWVWRRTTRWRPWRPMPRICTIWAISGRSGRWPRSRRPNWGKQTIFFLKWFPFILLKWCWFSVSLMVWSSFSWFLLGRYPLGFPSLYLTFGLVPVPFC